MLYYQLSKTRGNTLLVLLDTEYRSVECAEMQSLPLGHMGKDLCDELFLKPGKINIVTGPRWPSL